jgi:prevent-host-death family protein
MLLHAGAIQMTTFSSRELNQDVGRAKRAAELGPVVITDRGRPSHVLLSWDAYQRLSGGPRDLGQVLAMPDLSEIDLTPEPAQIAVKPADLD